MKLPRWVVLWLSSVGIALAIAAQVSGQTPSPAYTLSNPYHYSIVNLSAHTESPQLCGRLPHTGAPDTTGTFFNSLDHTQLVDTSAFAPPMQIMNGQLWAPVYLGGGFYETTCYSQWSLCQVPLNALEGICTPAKAWIVLPLDLSRVIGQSDTLGGTITPITVNTFTCPVTTPTRPPATATARPGVPTSTPVPPTAIPPTSTPNPACAGEIKQLSDGGCYCTTTGQRVPCPGGAPPTPSATPDVKPPVTRTFAPPIRLTPTLTPTDEPPTVTPTLQPSAVPTATPGGGGSGGGISGWIYGLIGAIVAALIAIFAKKKSA